MILEMLEKIIEAIQPMLNNRLDNYIIPGLASSLVGGPEHGKVRLFSTNREARDFVTPHSHRFDFTALVLEGAVKNTLYYQQQHQTGDAWCISTIDQVCGADGIRSFVHTREQQASLWNQRTSEFVVGQTYPKPWVNGKVVPTFKVEPWMFERSL